MGQSLNQPVWVTAALRSALGKFDGALATTPAVNIAGAVMRELTDWSEMLPDTVYMGQVLQAGVGQAPARQAAQLADMSDEVPVTTVNKVCGSGMQSVILGCDQIRLGRYDMIVAGGMENMSLAPFLQPRCRPKMGHFAVNDHLFTDGLENSDDHQLMGHFGELLANVMGYTRRDLDEWAVRSVTYAKKAIKNGYFQDEIVAVAGVETDEIPPSLDIGRIETLRPVFQQEGVITAANASAMADGAAALLLMSEAQGQRLGVTPLAYVVGYCEFSHAAKWFTTAPIYAVQKLLTQLNWQVEDVDLWEINEAFAVVTVHAIHTLKIPADRVNIQGGACALGHPLGATGARIMVSLIHALRRCGLTRGIAVLCIGGGEATAIAVEIPS
ncbi:thiolase family protein [Thaumasiovibrio sp. DFM-14]|uniref:thiolase family protein n=1 Tax=Thaumasiovibrio sp. DFM-14 TaxID=3384792 RepID=UPI0039A28CB2